MEQVGNVIYVIAVRRKETSEWTYARIKGRNVIFSSLRPPTVETCHFISEKAAIDWWKMARKWVNKDSFSNDYDIGTLCVKKRVYFEGIEKPLEL